MGKSKDLATGNSAAYVETAGDTMSGALTVDTSTTTNLNVDSANYGGIQFKAAGTDTGYITSYTNGSGAESMYIGGADTVNIHTGTNHALSNGTTRLAIDASGYVTKPNQPSFAAYVQNAQTGYDANTVGNSYVIYNTDLYDTGNNHSNGLFTAPVSGVYYFIAEAYTSEYCTQSWFIVHGARTNASDSLYTGNDAPPANSIILKLAANDTVGFHPYRSGYNSITVNANANHSWFRGMLLG